MLKTKKEIKINLQFLFQLLSTLFYDQMLHDEFEEIRNNVVEVIDSYI